MQDNTAKIYFKKTSEGKTKKVVVKRIKKTLKLKKAKPKLPPAAAVPSSTHPHKSSPKAHSKPGEKPPFRKDYGKDYDVAAGAAPGGHKKTSPHYKTKSPANTARRGGSSGGGSGGLKKPYFKDRRDKTKDAATYASKDEVKVPANINDLLADKIKSNIPQRLHANKKKSKIYITKKDTKRGSSFERASSKRKLKRSSFRIYSRDEGFETDPTQFHDQGPPGQKVGDGDVYTNVPSKIEIGEVVSIVDLARKLNLKASQLIKKFFSLGVVNLRIGDKIDADSAQIVCNELGCEVEVVSLIEQTKIETDKGDPKDYLPRPPVLTIMGHVDHGKTTLLSTITGTKMQSEAGDITQHLSAYTIERPKRKLIFLDTPGHSAFFSMRAKGAKITDFLLLIIALPEGLKHQTLEVLALVKNSDIPMIIAVTKIDLITDLKERERLLTDLKNRLAEKEVNLKEWGGTVPLYPISATTREGIEELLAGIEELAEKHNITGNPKVRAYGYVIESQVVLGRGHVVTVVIKNGTMQTGDAYLCHKAYGKVRALFDEKDNKIDRAYPGMVVRVIGLSKLIPSGQFFQTIESERHARATSEKRYELEQLTAASDVKKVTVSNLFSAMQKEQIKEFRLIIKADTYGSVEAIHETLKQFTNDEVKTAIIHHGVGSVNENDVHLAVTTQAQIIAFKLKTSAKIKAACDKENLVLKHFEVIHDIIDYAKENLAGMMGEDIEEIKQANAKIKEIFKISKIGKAAGCEVLSGKLKASHQIRVLRDEATVYTGTIMSLRRFKDSVAEVTAGAECGLVLKNFENFQVGDTVETFTTKVKKRALNLEEKTFS